MQTDEMQLCNVRPAVCRFHQAVEGRITRRFYPTKQVGRPSDGFIYVTEGKMRYRFLNGNTIDVSSGDVLFLSRGSIYSMELMSDCYKYVFADFDFEDGVCLTSVAFSMQSFRGIESLFRRMLEKWRLQKLAVNEDCMAILYSIYAEILRAQSVAYIPLAKRTRLDAAVQFISENFADESLTVESVAATAAMSESHFRRLFKSTYQVSPVKYINLIRINRAKELIRYSNTSFSQIALDTGFANLYYFSRIFKKEVGCTPSEYREAYSDYQET
ncbi:MAG: helix-turn-helix domain-containing protein [Clostridia bacterium]|nr:helix-turn-helix domain-containing protein [Clostridia bacterium]